MEQQVDLNQPEKTNGRVQVSLNDKKDDAHEAAKAVFSATIRFYHPAHASEWSAPLIDADFAQVMGLVLAGLVVGKQTLYRPD